MVHSLPRIRFSCGTCMTPLEVRARFAGRQVRCPYCHTRLTVPLESRPEKREEYGIAGPTGEPLTEEELARHYITVNCSLCDTRMYATEEQVGQTLICPDCETPNVVPAPPKPLKTRSSKTPPPPPPIKEEYGVAGPTGEQASEAESPRLYIPVVCSLCHTRLLATEDQVGQTMTCPDCATVNPVKPPKEMPKLELPTAEEVGEYGMGASQGKGAGAGQEDLFPFKCPLCRTRFHARRDAAGREMICPDCFRPFVIPQPPPKPPGYSPKELWVEEYRPGPAVERNWKVLLGDAKPIDAAEEASPSSHGPQRRQKPSVPKRERQPLPPWPLVNGVFDFPFHGSARNQWLAACATGVLFFGAAGLAVFSAGYTGLFLIIAVLFFAALAVATMIWIVWFTRICLAIVADTAGGSEEVYNWPSGDWVDHFLDSFYLFNTIAYSGAFGLLFERLFMEAGSPPGPGLLVGIWLAFPIVLLSLLETNSRINFLSPAIWKSLFVAWRGWLGFYGLSALLWGVTIGLGAALLFFVGGWGVVPAVIALMTTVMIYFRLLGRLGHYITDKMRRADRAQED